MQVPGQRDTTYMYAVLGFLVLVVPQRYHYEYSRHESTVLEYQLQVVL